MFQRVLRAILEIGVQDLLRLGFLVVFDYFFALRSFVIIDCDSDDINFVIRSIPEGKS